MRPWLGLVGALLLLGGVLAAWAGLVSQDSFLFPTMRRGFFLGGLILLVVGAPHLAAAVGVWRRRRWGRWLGGVVGGIGLVASVLAVIAVLLAVDLAESAAIVESAALFALLAVPAVVGYGLALVGSVIWYPTDPPTPT